MLSQMRGMSRREAVRVAQEQAAAKRRGIERAQYMRDVIAQGGLVYDGCSRFDVDGNPR